MHRPSTAILPIFPLIFGVVYYWVFGADIVSYSILRPSYSIPSYSHIIIPILFTVLFLCFEYLTVATILFLDICIHLGLTRKESLLLMALIG